jgi:hypothetical protein
LLAAVVVVSCRRCPGGYQSKRHQSHNNTDYKAIHFIYFSSFYLSLKNTSIIIIDFNFKIEAMFCWLAK